MSTETFKLDSFEWTTSYTEIFEGNTHFCYSPIYHLRKSSWQLKATKMDLTRIDLFRVDFGPPKTFTCTIKSNVNNIVAKITGDFDIFVAKQVLAFHPKEVQSISDILITCCIEKNTSHPKTTETTSKKYISCAVQTEDTNSVIGNENPKDEDWSSIDIKDDTLIREGMKDLLTKGIEHDVTICVKNKQYRAHRIILSTRSPVFAMMLSHDTKEKNTGVIEIEDCDPESFYEFLLYVYSGRTENLTPSNSLQLYYSADKYDFPVLKERCVKILKNSLSIESICDVVLLAAKHLEKELLEVATEFFARNMKNILVTVSWQKFMSQNQVEANELLIKSMEIINPKN